MKIRGFRWWIAGLLLLASILNYLDRNPVSVLVPGIQRALNLAAATNGDARDEFRKVMPCDPQAP